jgi:glycosyltransferase involved in cell wall biosynthesis
MGCNVVFSRSHSEGVLMKMLRLGLRVILGFDVVHAYRQRNAMRQADIVWTHTESQYLAVATIFRGRPDRPLLLGQSIWLFDRWPRLNPFNRVLYGWLIRRVNILTVLSEENLAAARDLFPSKRVECVPFGIPSEHSIEPQLRRYQPIRVAACGNDPDRDWATLIEAARGQAGIEVSIFSATAHPRLARGMPNVSIRTVKTNAELHAELAKASVMCVPLRANKHASGITVIQEAILAGLPVIATDTGGLRGYFGPDEISYVPVGDVAAMRTAICAVGPAPEDMLAMARRAQLRMRSSGMGAEAYVRRHVELSRQVLAEQSCQVMVSGRNDGLSSTVD